MLNEAESLERGGVVAGDLACMGCGYNLRTLAVEGVCTECGAAVGTSLARARKYVIAFRRIGLGAILIVLAIGADNWGVEFVTWILEGAAIHFGIYLEVTVWYVTVLSVGPLISILALIAGICLLRSGAPTQSRKWFVICLILALLILVMRTVYLTIYLSQGHYIFNEFLPPLQFWKLFEVISCAILLLEIGLSIAGSVFVRKLGPRIGKQRLMSTIATCLALSAMLNVGVLLLEIENDCRFLGWLHTFEFIGAIQATDFTMSTLATAFLLAGWMAIAFWRFFIAPRSLPVGVKSA